MMYIVFSLFFLLDGILSNFLPYLEGTLSLFTPYLSVVFIFLMVPFYRKDEAKKYYLTVAIFGFLYDIFYTNFWMCHVLLFLLLAVVSKKIWKNIQMNCITIPIFIALIIGLYHLSFLCLFVFFNMLHPSIDSFFYLWSHSILLNVIIGEIFYLLFDKWNKKYHRMHS